jgi:TonB-dependent starch-binding outer membrane protein SusC
MRKHFLLAIVLLVFSTITFAQQGVVTGTVKAEDGSPLPGATVQIKGTTNGTVTDLDGKYSLPISGVENPTLVFSYVGYLTEEIAVAGQTKIDIKLVTNISTVDEVVVVGYGTQKKSLVTGSIAKVNAEQLVTSAPTNVQQTLQGKTAGVTVSANSGQPGASPSVRIRGISSNRNSAPIYIVDGIRVGGIDYLDPNDIQNVEVMKDAASAAIYGAQGGNGVVYITTKKGKSGTQQVTYDFYYGMQQYSSKLKLLSGPEYVSYIQQGLVDEATYANPGATSDDITKIVNGQLDKFFYGVKGSNDLPALGSDLSTVQNTDWLKEINKNAPMMSHSIRFSGGTDKSLYSAGVSYYNQDGVTGGNKANFNRYTIMLNGENKATNWLTIGANATYSRRSRSSLNDNSEFSGIYGNAMLIDPLTPAIYTDSTQIHSQDLPYSQYFVRDDNGNPYGISQIVKNEIVNPLAKIQTAHGKFTEDKILAGAFFQLEPIKGLTFRSSYDVDVADNTNIFWSPAAYYQSLNFNKRSQTTQNDHRYYTWHFDNVLTYTKTIGKHNITAMVGAHAEEYKHTSLQGTGFNMIQESDAFASPGSIPHDTALFNDQALGNSYFSDPQRLSSLFGRLNYDYNNRYILAITVRQDNSSMLAPGHQKGTFPSYSLGWVISNEKFWSVPLINYLKARYSYGTNGSLGPINPFQYVSTMSFGSNYVYTNGADNALNGAAPTVLKNEKLTWEESKMFNLGLDMNMFNNKLNFIVDYYKKTTDGLLTTAPIAGYVGNSAPYANSGTVVNKGLELELGYRKAEGDFQYNVNANVSFNNNEVTAYGTPNGEGTGSNLGISGEVTHIKVGEPLYYMYGYKVDGVWQNQAQIDAENWVTKNGVLTEIQSKAQPGDIRVVDVNGDSTITPSDRTKIGNGTPKATAGLNLGASYKGFDLSANLVGAFGNDVYFGDYRSDLKVTNRPEFMSTDAWTPENQDADFFRPTVNNKTWNLAHNSMFVRKGSYVKLKTVTLGYNIPTELTKKIGISKMKIYFSCNNVLTITKYEGADPEIGSTNESNNDWSSIGIDRGYYPQSRQYLLGANITF